MLESDLIQSTSSWPFVEIRKLLKDRKDILNKKNKIIFQTGYGPSGLPHIGTFGEVSRTSMMINVLNHIKEIESELITFSDDMDGLRKVPENIPNEKVLHENLGKPLTDIMEKKDIDKVVEMTRMTAAEVIALKGGTVHAPGNAVGDMIESIIKDKKNVLPLSTYLNGEYNVNELCIGVPATLGRGGIQGITELQLESDEKSVFSKGVELLKKAILELNLN